MKPSILLSTLSSALLASSGIYAAETAELKVSGVIRPSACVATFPGNSVVHFGTLSAHAMEDDRHKRLPVQEVNMSISCDGPTKIAMRAVDNRATSRVIGLDDDDDDDANFGLGSVDGKRIGGYAITFTSAVTDGRTVDTLIQVGGVRDTGWRVSNSRRMRHDHSLFAFGLDKTPVAFTNLTTVLAIRATLVKRSQLPISDAIELDGSISFEMIYL